MTLDLALKLITTFFTTVLGIAASFLAYQQFKFNKNISSEQLRLADTKLKFDLYQKRLALFMILRNFAGQVVIPNEKIDAGKFYHDTIERYFLFDVEEYTYFDEVYQKAKELEHAKQKLSRPRLTETEEEAINAQIDTLVTWFFNQSDYMFKVFSNCLSIKTLRQPDKLSKKSSHPRLSN